MQMRLFLCVLTALTALMAAGNLNADQTTNKVVLTVYKTAPTNGRAMYVSYCASCHGLDGRGGGPVAPELKTPPTDLTVQSLKNHGKFPNAHIAAVLEFGTPTRAHGTAEMPVWGPILGKIDRDHPEQKQLRIYNLSRYLQTLQAK